MAKRTPAAAPAAHAMERCIDNCLNCHRICLETAARISGANPLSRCRKH